MRNLVTVVGKFSVRTFSVKINAGLSVVKKMKGAFDLKNEGNLLWPGEFEI